jgi:hypothetical protein
MKLKTTYANLKVRTNPSLSADVITKLPQGFLVNANNVVKGSAVYGNNKWAQVDTQIFVSGNPSPVVPGYVSMAFLKQEEVVAPPAPHAC